MPQEAADAWTEADAYEGYVGRWSRRLAPSFVAWAGFPSGGRVLDVGCGTAALSAALAAQGSRVVGLDQSQAYVERAKALLPGGDFRVGDALNLPFPDSMFDGVASALVLNFLPEPERAVAEMVRVARAGARVAAYVWDYAGGMEIMRYFWDAAAALDSGARSLDEGVRFPLCNPASLSSVWTAAGLRDVSTTALDQPTPFASFEDYWTPFLGGQGPAPGYCMQLPAVRRAALHDRLRASLPIRPDGRIHLTARAWAVRGTR